MNPHVQELIHSYLDGLLTKAEETELNSWVKASLENAKLFADTVRMHDHLRTVFRSSQMNAIVEPGRTATFHAKHSRWPSRIVGSLMALAAIILVTFWIFRTSYASAASELNRLIEKAPATGDRTYQIRTLDAKPETVEERRPPIDGALLHVRQPDQYVLIRKFPDGRPFITGSDGEQSWSIPTSGAVRLSNDPLRFRGPVPGHQHGIPFVDLRSDLVQLRDAYHLSSLKADAAGKKGILAIKKSAVYRGPNRVELWYEPDSGSIHRMIFSGMPKARGGPDSVSVELQEQRDLGKDFFQHQSHHATDRRVIEED